MAQGMTKILMATMLRASQVESNSRRGPSHSIRGTVNTTRNMERGMKERSNPTNLGGMSTARAKSTSAWPATHCQETTLTAVNSKKSREDAGRSRTAVRSDGLMAVKKGKEEANALLELVLRYGRSSQTGG
jgi:hypothetical protein